MILIEKIAGDIEKSYYQGYPEGHGVPFNSEFFIRQVRDTYLSRLQAQYDQQYTLLRQDRGQSGNIVQRMTQVNFDVQWLYPETVTSKKNLIELTYDIVGFQNDKHLSGVQNFIDAKGHLVERATQDDLWVIESTASPEVIFWYGVSPNKIRVTADGEYTVSYIPVPKKGVLINDNLSDEIKDIVLRRMFAAKNGNMTDMTNDGNPNAGKESETNKETIT